MSKITKLKLPSKDKLHSYIIAGDWHSEHISNSSYNILLKMAKLIPKEQRRLIINGDFLDCVHLMGKKGDLTKLAKDTYVLELLAEESEVEYKWGNEKLDELQNIFDYIYFVEGNHDWRYRNFMDNYAPHAYKHNFNYVRRLELKERGIPFVKYNDWIDIGDLSITHGMYHGPTAIKKHYEVSGSRNVIFSHIHYADSKSFIKRGSTVKVWSLPAMSKLSPEYLKNRENNWTNGFATVHMKHNGNFQCHIHEIWNNELILPTGKIIKGD